MELTFSTQAEAKSYDLGLEVGKGRGVAAERARMTTVIKDALGRSYGRGEQEHYLRAELRTIEKALLNEPESPPTHAKKEADEEEDEIPVAYQEDLNDAIYG